MAVMVGDHVAQLMQDDVIAVKSRQPGSVQNMIALPIVVPEAKGEGWQVNRPQQQWPVPLLGKSITQNSDIPRIWQYSQLGSECRDGSQHVPARRPRPLVAAQRGATSTHQIAPNSRR